MPEAVIVAATRSPIGRAFKGSLKDVRPDDLAATVIRAALDQVPELDVADIDDLMLGCGLPGGEQGFNMGRVVSVLLGLDQVPGTTITRYCASSLQTSRMALHAIKAGEGDVFISAGVETVSRFVKGHSDSIPDTQNPIFAGAATRVAAAAANGATSWIDPRDGGELPDVYIDMGQTAENLALLKGVTRAEMDEFALRSQNLAEKATIDGFWTREITPITLPDGTVIATDDCPRPGVTREGLGGLRPVFRPDGRVTAGNACPLNDGAAALIIMSDTKARDLDLTPLARIVSTGVTGLSPELMGYGPVQASRQALARAGMTVDDLDLVEINEAFAAQVIPSYRDLGIDLDRLNVHGGAIALGHPFGMSGARITVLEEQTRRAASIQLRIADGITAFAGSMQFVYLHIALFAVWMVFLESRPWPTLTLTVSLEAIFLSTFVMIGQNRQAAFQQAKADHDFNEQELELKTNTQLTIQIHRLTTELHGRVIHSPAGDRSRANR